MIRIIELFMTQVSKHRLSEKVEAQIKNIFAEIISQLSGKENILSFLNEFLTQTEKIVLAKRITIAFMLEKGYHQILDKILLQEKIKTSFDQIENFILNTLTLGHGKGTSFWKELKKRKKFDDSNHRTFI